MVNLGAKLTTRRKKSWVIQTCRLPSGEIGDERAFAASLCDGENIACVNPLSNLESDADRCTNTNHLSSSLNGNLSSDLLLSASRVFVPVALRRSTVFHQINDGAIILSMV
jgi:hypothetical protein